MEIVHRRWACSAISGKYIDTRGGEVSPIMCVNDATFVKVRTALFRSDYCSANKDPTSHYHFEIAALC